MNIDYTASCPLKVVTLTLDNGDKIPMVAQFDHWNKAWFANLHSSCGGACDVSFSLGRIDSGYKISEVLEKTASADVGRFYFGILSTYSSGEVCQHIVTKKVGDWNLLEHTVERKFLTSDETYLDITEKSGKVWKKQSAM